MTQQRSSQPASRATIEDVAAAANVSVATVSRALRGLPNVAASTRSRVEQVAADLSYSADPAARRLATGRSRSLAVLVPFVNTWYCAEIMAGVEAVCAEAGYDMVVIALRTEHGDRRPIDGTEALHRRVDGIVVVDVALDPVELDEMISRGLAVVSIGPPLHGCASTGIDDVEVGRLATEHLIRLGHRRIGIIGDTTDNVFGFVVPTMRQRGYAQALAAADIEVDDELIVDGSFTVQGGAEAFDQLMALDDPPTAIFAIGDIMALGAMQRARDLGIEIPRDVSIVGVDDQPVAEVLGLTTVHQDVAEHGARVARWLVDLLRDDDHSVERFIAPIHLVERTTTSSPATAHVG
ncbi:MAG: LacI family transcriptional regulator [Acidimicrobiaceae bacterium]|nr:LacI family transcriptional regulator [Acidimicrobiaceae bacterium]